MGGSLTLVTQCLDEIVGISGLIAMLMRISQIKVRQKLSRIRIKQCTFFDTIIFHLLIDTCMLLCSPRRTSCLCSHVSFIVRHVLL